MLRDAHTGLLENGLMKNYGDCMKWTKSRQGLAATQKTPKNQCSYTPKAVIWGPQYILHIYPKPSTLNPKP